MSLRRVVSAVLIPTTLLLFTGCTKTVWIGPEELQPEHKIKGVVTADGQEVKLDPAAANLKGDTIYSGNSGASSEILRFPLGDVQQVGVRRTDVLASVGLALGVAAAAFVALVTIFIIHCSSTQCWD